MNSTQYQQDNQNCYLTVGRGPPNCAADSQEGRNVQCFIQVFYIELKKDEIYLETWTKCCLGTF